MLNLKTILGGVGFCVATVVAAAVPENGFSYQIPSTWKVPNITASYETLRGRSQTAIDRLRSEWWKDPSQLDKGWGTGTSLGALPYKDLVASTRSNYNFVRDALRAAKAHNKNFDPYGYNDDAMWWGTTSAYAYRAYGDKEFLNYAKDVWNWVKPSQVTKAQATAGKSSVRATKFSSKCNGHSVAGSVFWRSESSDKKSMGVNVITTSLFMTLSAYLAEATGEQKYINSAKLSYEFITTVLMKRDPNIPTDGLGLVKCDQNGWIFNYNSGKFIEGAIILSGLTKDNKYRYQAVKTAVHGMKRVKNWNNLKNGHITDGQSGDPAKGNDGRQFKAIYVRALTDAARRENARGNSPFTNWSKLT